jgi:glycosyltransferase involved in cell wall biosynthesis
MTEHNTGTMVGSKPTQVSPQGRLGVSGDRPDVSVIIPAFNEAAVIGDIIAGIFQALGQTDYAFELLVVDDGSQDETAKIAERAGACVVRHPYNIGNGAAVKTGIRRARGSLLVMLDGDGQHDPQDIPRLLEKLGPFDLVVGARSRESETELHRDLANHVYNRFASYVCGRRIDDLTSGFRAIKGDIGRGFLYLLPNTFSYPATITLATVRAGYSLTYVPIVTARRGTRSKIKLVRDGTRFLLIILRIATFFSPLKVFLPVSALMFLVGVGYGLFKVVALGSRYGPTSAMLMTVSVVIFLIGLVSEQIAQLRFDRSETFDQRQNSDIAAQKRNHDE